MRSSAHRTHLALAALCCGSTLALYLACVCSTSGATDGVAVRGKKVWLPSVDDNGVLKSQVFGSSAVLRRNQHVEVENLQADIFDGGTTDITITAATCLYKPKPRQVTSEAEVRLERENVLITGRGFRWQEAHGCVEIFNDVTVVIQNIDDLTGKVALEGEVDRALNPSSATGTTVITSGQLCLYYERRVGVFKKSVRAVHGDTTISAEEMAVSFKKDNTASMIAAKEKVEILWSDIVATCNSVSCDLVKRASILRGAAEVRSGPELIRGERIVILQDQNKLVLEPGYFSGTREGLAALEKTAPGAGN